MSVQEQATNLPYGLNATNGKFDKQIDLTKGLKLGGDMVPSTDNITLGSGIYLKNIRTKGLTLGVDGLSLGGNIDPTSDSVDIGIDRALRSIHTNQIKVGGNGLYLSSNIILANENITLGFGNQFKQTNTKKLVVGSDGISLSGSLTLTNANVVLGEDEFALKNIKTVGAEIGTDGLSLGGNLTPVDSNTVIGATRMLKELRATKVTLGSDGITRADGIKLVTDAGKKLTHVSGTDTHEIFTEGNKPTWSESGGDSYFGLSGVTMSFASAITSLLPDTTNTVSLGSTGLKLKNVVSTSFTGGSVTVSGNVSAQGRVLNSIHYLDADPLVAPPGSLGYNDDVAVITNAATTTSMSIYCKISGTWTLVFGI